MKCLGVPPHVIIEVCYMCLWNIIIGLQCDMQQLSQDKPWCGCKDNELAKLAADLSLDVWYSVVRWRDPGDELISLLGSDVLVVLVLGDVLRVLIHSVVRIKIAECLYNMNNKVIHY